jgi:hypothetical protein
MSGLRKFGAMVVLTGLLTVSGTMTAQQNGGCTLQKQVYTCDWQAFAQQLDKAKSISIETQSMDRFTARQLRQLAGELGKSVVPDGQQGDLTFLVIPLPSTGVHIGPAGEPLATLRIYAPEPGNARGKLLWAEIYTGDPDRPWPAIVHALIQQFHARIQRH